MSPDYLTIPPRPNRYPRRRLNPAFITAIQESHLSREQQALLAGFAQTTHLCYLLYNRPWVSLTPVMRPRLTRLAEAVHYPVDQMFLEEAEQAATR